MLQMQFGVVVAAYDAVETSTATEPTETVSGASPVLVQIRLVLSQAGRVERAPPFELEPALL